MTINTLKAELTKKVPIELTTNVDFWLPIRESIRNTYWNKSSPIIPKTFIHYLSHKYNYSLETLKTDEYVNHIILIAKKLYDDPEYFKNTLTSVLPPIIQGVTIDTPYEVGAWAKSERQSNKAKKRNRDRLLIDTPVLILDK